MDGENAMEIFSQSWCKQLQNDPKWKLLPGRAEVIPGDNRFMNEILKSDSTIPSIQCFRNSQNDYRFLMYLGAGLSGNKGILHGGVISTILDAIMGATAIASVKRSTRTATMKTDFKKPLPVNSLVLCKSWVERIEGRRIWTRGSLEDGDSGQVYATGEAIFIKIRLSLL